MVSHDVEIERKYLLRALPAATATAPWIDIDQGYLPGERILERLRRITRPTGEIRYVRTVKLGAGVQRFEFEEETTEAFFAAVWPLTRGRRVQKRRYTIATEGDEWIIDQFLDRPLVLAELELDSPNAEVRLPAWLGDVLDREVTDDGTYTNYRLAR